MTVGLDDERAPVLVFDALRRHARAVVLTLGILVVGVLGYRQLDKPPAVAESDVVVENPRLDASGLGASDPVSYFASQLALARLPIVTRSAINGLGPSAAGVTLGDLKISSDPASDTIIFTASLPEGSDDLAVRLTDAVVASYVSTATAARRQQAQVTLTSVTASLDSLGSVAQSLGAASLRLQLTNQQVALREQVAAPTSLLTASGATLQPSGRPGLARLGLVIIIGGTLAGSVAALTRDGSSRQVSRVEDAQRLLGVPLVGRLTLGEGATRTAQAVWESLAPDHGWLLVIPVGAALQANARDSDRAELQRMRELTARYDGTITVLTLPFRSEDYGHLTADDTEVTLVVGPRTRTGELAEVRAELNRVRLIATGMMWTETPSSGGGAPAVTKRRLRQPVASAR